MNRPSFRTRYPLSWSFHANTARFAHNAEPPPEDVAPGRPREHPGLPFTRLPEPLALPRNLDELLHGRSSCRRFASEPLTLAQLATTLDAAYGVCGVERVNRIEFANRPVPSGGGLYPLEVNLICRHVHDLSSGIYHYLPTPHALECLKQAELPDALLAYLFMGQAQLVLAPVIMVISAEFDRTMKKYGDRGYRYVLLEAGHLMQNVNLTCMALGLGSCNIGGLFDDELGILLGLPSDREAIVYAAALGVPADTDRQTMRDL